MKKVKFAIIGCGRIAYRHIEAIEANSNGEIVALCDLNLDRAKERLVAVKQEKPVHIYQNYHEMLTKENIDVVNIMTPSGMHTEHGIEIISRYKKHIVMEKPFALSVADGERLLALAKKHKVKIFVVHQNRFNKAVQKIKSAIDNKMFGKIAIATARIRWSRGQTYFDRDAWRGTWALDGGALTNQSIHHLDLLRWLVGDVESVSAVAKTQFVNVEVEDSSCGWIKFKNGAIGTIEATTAARPLNKDLEASISILGEKGAVIVEGFAVNKLSTWTFGDINFSDFSEASPNVYGFGHNIVIDNVIDVILNGGEPLVSGEDAMKSVKLLSAIYKSIESKGKEVLLKDNPISSRLGIFNKKSNKIADLYRTPSINGKRKKKNG